MEGPHLALGDVEALFVGACVTVTAGVFYDRTRLTRGLEDALIPFADSLSWPCPPHSSDVTCPRGESVRTYPCAVHVSASRGIRQEDLAYKIAFSRNYLQGLENGKPNLYVTRLFRTMNTLGITISVSYTLGDKTERQD